ncbi:MAG: precorrin-2 C(20)-methyltransferase [Mangrovicoccus sp.]|nr:precorrin-2 C(20)-methyltransferase [Mangrovicoccus sp.]
MAEQGVLIGVGLGPGDPGLITRRAAGLIEAAQVIAYPALAGGESFARSIAADLIPAGAAEIRIDVPMSRARKPAQDAYDQGAAEIAAHLQAGRDVVALCEGDPLFYGSFMYLQARLADRFLVEVVPGVTSITACAAQARLPLAARDGVVTILPATLPDAQLSARMDGAETLVLMKLGRHLPRIRTFLAAQGLLDRATYVARAGLPDGVCLPLAEAPEEAPYFSMILVAKETDPWL